MPELLLSCCATYFWHDLGFKYNSFHNHGGKKSTETLNRVFLEITKMDIRPSYPSATIWRFFFLASTIMSFTWWCVVSAALLRQYTYHPYKVFVLGKKRRLQERSKFPQFSFSPQNAGTGNMYSVPWFLHTHGHKCDNQTMPMKETMR